MRTRKEIVAAARGCVGARFRPHGRNKAFGLDCVGVAGIAFGITPPDAYALRTADFRDVAAAIMASGLLAAPVESAGPGDLLLIGGGPGQLHLVVLTEAGFVHADARLRRVVEAPGQPDGAVLSAWRGGR